MYTVQRDETRPMGRYDEKRTCKNTHVDQARMLIEPFPSNVLSLSVPPGRTDANSAMHYPHCPLVKQEQQKIDASKGCGFTSGRSERGRGNAGSCDSDEKAEKQIQSATA